jgi:hypothetical protein
MFAGAGAGQSRDRCVDLKQTLSYCISFLLKSRLKKLKHSSGVTANTQAWREADLTSLADRLQQFC